LPALHAFSGGVNVLVERPGTDARAAAVLLGAHFDTVKGSPGADDNASGVAVVLEVARLLSGRKFRRPLRLAFFDLEEQGLLGSARYAASEERLDGLDSVVIVEMAGYCDRRKGSQRVPPGLPAGLAPDVGDFIAAVADLEHAALLAPFRRAAGADRPPVYALPVPEKGRALPDTRRSDHSPFWDRGVGAVLITDTAELRSPHYHQPSDTPETLDPVFLTGVATVVAEAVAELLDAPPATPPPASPGSSQ
ncbi:MAG: M20/M25/M40 family metallo-hydrolase, partial [Myxococcales bacterium]|nr:M20/M25/M40 family metallo-hydrolase [Myxococcales bacterium]